VPDMTPRERVLTALNHEEPDRVPFILGADLTTGMMRRTYRAVKAALGVEAEERYMYGTWKELGSARIDEATLRALGSDARGVWDRKPRAVEQRNLRRASGEPYVDDFGIGHVETGPEETFPHIHPLTESTLDALEAYPWPDMSDPTRFDGVRERAARLAAEGEYAVFAAPWLLFPFERACQLQGMDTFLMNMAANRDFAAGLLRKLTDLYKEHLTHFLAALDGHADVLVLGDDLGTQERLLISPRMYRKMLKPLHAELIAFAKERADLRVFFHSDGDIVDVIDDLIEIGVDILNPVQTSAGKMADLPALKARYGDRLTFCGAVDTHHVLPQGTPAEVDAEVKRVIDILGPRGGYMVASVHTIINDVPAENVLALADAVRRHGRYPVGGG
jgi:uroporphyrinogen decarboxylase